MITELISSESATSFGALYRTLYYLCCGGITLALLLVFRNRMPCDQGRAYAVNGELSRGKIRGVGIHFCPGLRHRNAVVRSAVLGAFGTSSSDDRLHGDRIFG